ncbi:tetratricopeptide repeat protein [Sphingomonas sp. 37zxx]|uniref:tetratricopeptide repeat protein n=1 Tax=Sphingomonas sp. 37zxx TaxID=1550073 RepID=UPI0006902D9C|nr:tetratricopeptide repeat protein [Sphingomonas sp. 37zxx]
MRMTLMGYAALAAAIWSPPVQAGAQSDARDRQSIEAVANLEAYAAYKMGHYADALARWEALAAAGNTTAMINLANMYDQGQGVAADPAAALGWTRMAAERGDPRAEYELAMFYERGVRLARDPVAAEGWFRRAAGRDHLDSQFALAVMLITARGAGMGNASPAQAAEGREWLVRAAVAGHAEARELLAGLP